MARKKRRKTTPSLPQIKGEIWEVGRRSLDVSIAELEQRGEQPEVLLAIQLGETGGVVNVEPISSNTPASVLGDFAWRSMQQPHLGSPRRPEVIRVTSQAEAELLAVALNKHGVAIEIVAQHDILHLAHADLESSLGGMTSDYRTQAAQNGESLSTAGLEAFFRAAEAFYHQELWALYDDDALFEISLTSAQGPVKTLYGIIMGSMGEEFGLALFYSLPDLERFYQMSAEHLDQFSKRFDDDTLDDPAQRQAKHEITAQFLEVSTLALTYTSQSEVPPSLIDEARQLNLLMANDAAFPMVFRTAEGQMQLAGMTDLGDVYVAIQAILDWYRQLDEREEFEDRFDDVGAAISTQLPSVEGFVDALEAHTVLKDNPYTLEESVDDEFLEALAALADHITSSEEHVSPIKSTSSSTSKRTSTRSRQIYTLCVYLVDGPMSDEDAAQEEISRQIAIRGDQTLHDLHEAIFDAFERWEAHLYEFNLGAGPADRSQVYAYTGGWDDDDDDAGDPESTTLDDLNLEVERRFGYTFDMGDMWEHVIEVVAIEPASGRKTYPRVIKAVGTAPPQYPEDDDDDDDDDDW